ncbi:hypothetical protein CTKZ_12030 [Cellulomonas algicola]|uniref:Uncharacterized protein n=1 Tax=Cellulomonas algicola TaxID=2071633 RepID=A0A401UY67_9CELL|nr:hypothetical protein CTKZ_12030 [Cellulomonas algicola]
MPDERAGTVTPGTVTAGSAVGGVARRGSPDGVVVPAPGDVVPRLSPVVMRFSRRDGPVGDVPADDRSGTAPKTRPAPGKSQRCAPRRGQAMRTVEYECAA